MPNVLERILKEAHLSKASGKRFLAIFDLDSTLFDLTIRMQQIINSYAQNPLNRSRYPQECKVLDKVGFSHGDWSISEPIQRAGLHEADHKAFYADIHAHWVMCFFSNEFLPHDVPVPGAVEFVRELQQLGADIMYLTGRDIERMEIGTQASLREWGFPLDGKHISLRLKPHHSLDDAAFKLEVIHSLTAVYGNIWLFENEPVNLHLIQKNCPDVGLVFIETAHSGLEAPSELLHRIPHFEVNIEEFRKFLKLI